MSDVSGWDLSVEEEYKRVPQLKPEDVEVILEWASKQPHLPKIPKHRVAMTLRACDFSLERTKETIDHHFTAKTKMVDFFKDLDVNSKWTQITLKNLHIGMIPGKTENDEFIVFFSLKPTDTSEWKFEEYCKTVYMCVEMTHTTMGSGSGYHVVADVKEFGISHLLLISIVAIQNLLQFMQEASHYNIKALHFINGSLAMEKLYQLAKPFMSKELSDLIHIHPGSDTIFKFINEKYVPSDYGGSAPTLKEIHESMYQMLLKKNDWFKIDCQLLVDESKRPASSKKNFDRIEGSFRKLTVD